MKEAMLRKLTDLMGEEDGWVSGVESGDEEAAGDDEIIEDTMVFALDGDVEGLQKGILDWTLEDPGGGILTTSGRGREQPQQEQMPELVPGDEDGTCPPLDTRPVLTRTDQNTRLGQEDFDLETGEQSSEGARSPEPRDETKRV